MENLIQPSLGSNQPRRRSSLQFEKQQLEKIIAVMGMIPGQPADERKTLTTRNTVEEKQGNTRGRICVSFTLLLFAAVGVAWMTLSANQRSGLSTSEDVNHDSNSPSYPNLRRSLSEEEGQQFSVDASMIGSVDNAEGIEYEDDDDEEMDLDEDEDDSEDYVENETVGDLVGRDLKQKKKKKSPKTPKLKLKLRESDLDVWQRFHTDLMGQRWRMCNSYTDPCNQGDKCKKKVKCKPFGDELRLVSIVLPNNRLNGFVPGRELARLDQLKKINLSNKKGQPDRNNLGPALPCFELTQCQADLKCSFGNTNLLSGVTYCSKSSRDIHLSDLFIWKQLFLLTNGTEWNFCPDSFDEPCGCFGDDDHYVMCEEIAGKLRITAVVLPGNGLVGALGAYSQDLRGWTEVRELDLSDNPLLQGCVGLEECDSAVVDEATAYRQCDISGTKLSVCEDISGEDDDDGTFPGTTDPLRLDELDQSVWEQLYDSLNGLLWKRCSASRANPCAFPQCVLCAPSPSSPLKRKITEITLADNRLSGELPLGALFQLNSTLHYFDGFSTNPLDADSRNIFTNQVPAGSCLSLPIGWNVTGSGIPVCELTGEQLIELDEGNDGIDSLLESLIESNEDDDDDDDDDQTIELAVDEDDYEEESEGDMQLGREGQIPIHQGDLAAYQAFYRGLHGEAWSYCGETISDPCGGCEEDRASFERVVCLVEFDPTTQDSVLRISEITLQNNNLHGVLNVAAINQLPRLSILDLANTPFSADGEGSENEITTAADECVKLDVCARGDSYCNFNGLDKIKLC